MSRSARAHLLLFSVVAGWGSTFVLVKRALVDVTPLLFNLLRMGLAFVCLAIVYRRHWSRITRAGWTSGALVGLMLGVAYQFQTSGLRLTTPPKSAFITGLTLVLVPLVSALPGVGQRGAKSPAWNVWAGVLLAFTGVALLAAPVAEGAGLFALPDFAGIGRGDLLTFGCAVAFTFHIIIQDRVSAKDSGPAGLASIPFEQLALLQVGFCALVMAVSMPVLERPHIHLTPLVAFAVVFEAVFATAVAFTAQSWVQQFLAPTYLVLIYAMEPVFAWLTSLAILHQGLSARAACGAGLILAGVLVAELIGRKASPVTHSGTPSSNR